MCSWGTGLNPWGQIPLAAAGKTMCVRWLALSMFVPSQQLGKSRMRSTLLLPGQSGYFVVVRSSKPVQVHWALALTPAWLAALALTVMARRNDGIAATVRPFV